MKDRLFKIWVGLWTLGVLPSWDGCCQTGTGISGPFYQPASSRLWQRSYLEEQGQQRGDLFLRPFRGNLRAVEIIHHLRTVLDQI